jgi:integrase/recombinase XerD
MEGTERPALLTDALADYQATYMAFRNMAPRTRIEYGRDLKELIVFLEGSLRLSYPALIQQKHLEYFLAALDHRGLSGASRRRKTAAIRSFFGFLEGHGYVTHNVALRLRPPEREEKEPRVLSEEEYKRLQEACRVHPRDQAIVELFLQTGIRVSELSSLKHSDVTVPARVSSDKAHAGSVLVRGKGRKERTITLNWKACEALRLYFAVRGDASDDSLFVSKFGRPLGIRAVQDAVGKCFRRAGIQRATVHTLRHTFGTHQVKKGTNLRVVQEAMGHSDLKTTSLYVHLARDQMDEQLQANAL